MSIGGTIVVCSVFYLFILGIMYFLFENFIMANNAKMVRMIDLVKSEVFLSNSKMKSIEKSLNKLEIRTIELCKKMNINFYDLYNPNNDD